MKTKKAGRGLIIFVLLASSALSQLRAEITIDQVREEIRKERNQEKPSPASRLAPDIKPGEDWGNYTPTTGFMVTKSDKASMNINGYVLFRYLDQLPAEQTYTDHLGVTHDVNPRRYFSAPHRVLFNFYGFLFDPKFNYTVTLWTVNAINTVAIIGNFNYKFCKQFNLFVGVGSNPGTRSLTYSHPYWLANDRVMADDFFRPGFTQGVWATGEILPGFFYHGMLGNNITTINVSAAENKRDIAKSLSLWWMPTTKEFGPKGASGDFEEHKKVATRFGTSFTHSREDQLTTDPNNPTPDETQIHLADSLLLFKGGSLGAGIQVHKANYDMWAVDGGVKYKGWFFQTEIYNRWLSHFDATGGDLPVNKIWDHGFYVEAAKMVLPKKGEVYTAASLIYGDKDAGFKTSSDYLLGYNWFMYGTRDIRINFQANYVTRSAAGSDFGYYTGGQTGPIFSVSWSANF